MLFKIEHELAGRLRLRCPRYYFNLKQACAIEEAAEQLTGVTGCQANAATAGILLQFDPAHRRQILTYFQELDLEQLDCSEIHDSRLENKRLGNRLFDHLYRLTTTKLFMTFFVPAPISTGLVVINALSFVKEGFKSLARGKLDVNVLDAAAIGVSCLTGQYSQAANIMYLLSVSESLEDYTLQKSRVSLAHALAMDVDTVWLVTDKAADQADSAAETTSETMKQVALTDVRPGQVIHINAGSLIPLDGAVVTGEALVNQASMTGESEPVFKRVGSSVMSGTTVVEGSINIKVRTAYGESRIQQIINLLESTERNKAVVERRAGELADRLVPYSFLLFGGLLLRTGSLLRAASVLVVDYSCALRLALPVATMTAMLQCSHQQIAVRGSRALENFAAADVIVFDKTGTITTAEPHVVKVIPMPGYERDDILRTTACIEEHYPHSLALAIVQQARRENLNHEEEHTRVNYIIAHGLSTQYNDMEALVGSAHFLFEDSGIPLTPTARALIEQEGAGYSVIYLALGGELAGFICIEEPTRPEVPEVIGRLRQQGFKKIVMLTGDGKRAARRVAEANGFDDFAGDLLPEDKLTYIKDLQAQGHKVVMVGDGVNDSPALSQADVSVAMQDASDIARNVADVSLLRSNLAGLNSLRAISRALMTRLAQSYRNIIGFNSLLLGLAAFNVTTATTISLLHNGSTLAITGANMRPYPVTEVSKEEK